MSEYLTPECRRGNADRWPDAHALCPGPGRTAVEKLRCDCLCHTRRRPDLPPAADGGSQRAGPNPGSAPNSLTPGAY